MLASSSSSLAKSWVVYSQLGERIGPLASEDVNLLPFQVDPEGTGSTDIIHRTLHMMLQMGGGGGCFNGT